MFDRILLVVALIGLGIAAYLVMRPASIQTVQLEAVTPLSSQLSTPAPTITPADKPVSTVKPRPTQAIAPRATPKPAPQPAPLETSEIIPETKPVAPEPRVTTTPEPRATTPVAPKPETTAPSAPSLTVRQDAGTWSVQAGAFRTSANAETLRAKLIAAGFTARVGVGEDGISRVLVGSYATSAEAKAKSYEVSRVVPFGLR